MHSDHIICNYNKYEAMHTISSSHSIGTWVQVLLGMNTSIAGGMGMRGEAQVRRRCEGREAILTGYPLPLLHPSLFS